MNRNLALKRLCWKEYRQLLPLIVMLAAIGMVMQLLFLLSTTPTYLSHPRHFVLVGLPGLFAAGVGALLVGQERDTRTLFWMASLPILRKDIIYIKFLAGAVGLLAVWLISFLLFLFSYVVSDGRFSFLPELDVGYSFWYSVFLLVVGFATAWSFRSTFVGLLALVGIAMAFTVVSNVFLAPLTKDIYSTVAMILCIAAAVWLGWGAAQRALAPITPSRLTLQAFAGSSYFDRAIVDRRRIQSPWSALVWQFAVQNRAMLIGLVSLVVLPIAISFLALETRYSPADMIRESTSLILGPSLMIMFVAISWIGVVTFQGDNVNQRIRFLSDRGISPKVVWMTRQILPLGLMVLVVLFAMIFAVAWTFMTQKTSFIFDVGSFVLLATCFMWTIYSVTQWMSQIVRSPVITAILAPVVACLPFAYGSFLLEILETPIWVLAITTCLPMIATYRMTRYWMDARMGKRFWMEHCGWLAVAVLLPTLPFLVVFCTYPTMPSSERTKFFADVAKYRASFRPAVEISLLARQEPPSKITIGDEEAASLGFANNADTGESATATDEPVFATMSLSGMIGDYEAQSKIPYGATITEERELQFKHIELQLSRANSATPLNYSPALVWLMGDAILVRMRMQDDGQNEVLLNRYRRSIRLVLQMTYGIRLNPTLNMQQAADRNEAWLVREIQASGTKEMMGAELRDAVVTQLRDKAGRQKARYRALAEDFVKSQFKSQSNATKAVEHALGGFEITKEGNGTRLMVKRQIATVVWHMAQYLMAGDSAARLPAKEKVARDWGVSMKELQDTSTTFSLNNVKNSPGSLWFGEWEQQADSL